MIVYTIGEEKFYDKLVEANNNLKKLGKSDTYEGGIIFLKIDDAKSFIQKECHEDSVKWNFKAAIYEVEISSKQDIKKRDDISYNLLVSSKILSKVI